MKVLVGQTYDSKTMFRPMCTLPLRLLIYAKLLNGGIRYCFFLGATNKKSVIHIDCTASF